MSSSGSTAATFCATLVDEWIRSGVVHAVVAPGSRSTALAVALASRPEMNIHIFHDERSASFAALGVGLSTGLPAVLLCTSGTAATHFHGAVVEAHQSNVPIIVCTADRPNELRDVGAPQTINQTNLYGSAVRWFHDPGVPAVEASHSWRSLAVRAFDLTIGQRPGPVHLNLPFREPLLGPVHELPTPRGFSWSTKVLPTTIDPSQLASLAKKMNGHTGIIVAGKGATVNVLRLAEKLGWPVFADSRSNVRERHRNVIVGFDPLIRTTSFVQSHPPEIIVRIGEPPASKVLAQWITGINCEVVQISATETVYDPDHVSAYTYVGSVSGIVEALCDVATACEQSWLQDWNTAEIATQSAISEWTTQNFSEPTVARTVTASMKNGSNLVVSSSMPIRDVEWFGTVTPGVHVYSNRGANGIDGVISTAVGVALATQAKTTVLIGDVACLHDSNGLLGLSKRGVDISIVVTNNDGGSIFSFLPQATQVSAEIFELLLGTPHGVSFEHLAAAHNIEYVEVFSSDELVKALAHVGPRLIEIACDRSINVAQHEALNSAVMEAVAATM